MNEFINLISNILTQYDKVMVLKLFVDSEDTELKNMYIKSSKKHNKKIEKNIDHIDAGFDLFAPGNEACDEVDGDDLRFFGVGWSDAGPVNKLDFNVICSAKMVTDVGKIYNTGYYMYPRSSLSKTQLRLANSTGIIDAGYRGHLIGMFDVVNIKQNISDDVDCDYSGQKFDRYLQICAPGLVPIIVKIVNSKEELGEETERGDGGFGSTGR